MLNMGRMDIKDLEKKYKNMETEELIRIISVSKDDYLPEAITVAEIELRKRNVTKDKIAEVSDTQKKEDKAEQVRVETTPLTKRTKFFFTLFPALGFYYYLFQPIFPKQYKQKQKDAFTCIFKSLIFYLVLFGIIRLLHYLNMETILTYLLVIILLLVGLYKLS